MTNNKKNNSNKSGTKNTLRKRLKRIKKTDKPALTTLSTKKTSKTKDFLNKYKIALIGKISFVTLKVLLLIVVAVGCLGAGTLGGAMLGFVKTTDPLTKDQLTMKIETSYIYDSKGNVMAMLTGKQNQNREPVFHKDTPKYLRDAFISIEDERFEQHIGIDFKRIASAVVTAVTSRGKGHGGSTITQQVVRNITGRDERSIKRKVQEWYLAVKLEKMMEKWQILELYMNVIYMGNSCYGVQSASNLYFGKDVKYLSLAESALLAGITNSPTTYDPYNVYIDNGRENAIKRQRQILKKMLELEKIDQNEYDQALLEELIFMEKDAQTKDIKVQSYFVDHVINEVAKDFMEQKDMSQQMALTTIYSYGVVIHTTMDPDIQDTMDDVFLDDKYFHKNEKISQQPQAGMVVIDPNNGNLLAVRGGYGEKTASNILNRGTQIERPAGSSFKPLSVFGPALDRRIITAATIFDDVPVYFLGADKGKYPVNYTRYYEGLMTTRYAVKRSVNVPAAKAYLMFNNPNIPLEYLAKAGIVRDQKNLSIALGGLEKGVSPLQITAAYVPFANKGIYYEPVSYTKVTDKDGNIILEKKPNYNTVYDEAAAFIMTDILKDVCRPSRRPGELGGTAAGLGTIRNGKNEIIPTAGKTGTTDDDKDRWFVGYSNYYVSAVWYGYDHPVTVAGIPSGQNPAALIWNAVMKKIHTNKTPIDFPMPTDVVKKTICVYSGKIATDACRHDPRGSAAFDEYFIKGTEPADNDLCKTHIIAKVCKDSTDIWGHNLNAGLFCPAESIMERVYITRQPPYRLTNPGDPYPLDWKYEYPAGEFCNIHGRPIKNNSGISAPSESDNKVEPDLNNSPPAASGTQTDINNPYIDASSIEETNVVDQLKHDEELYNRESELE